MLKINRHLLPIKAHYFFFMGAMGPILPQLSVIGKELGLSSVVMGSVTGVLPIIFLLAKPLFGIIVDVYRNQRKAIFMGLIFSMSAFYACLYFVPARITTSFALNNTSCQLDTCNVSDYQTESKCNTTKRVLCELICSDWGMNSTIVIPSLAQNVENINSTKDPKFRICSAINVSVSCDKSCNMFCMEDIETDNGCVIKSYTFWLFVILMSLGTIAFNVGNSISDAVCFDVIGDKYDYGQQRVWGTIGFGLTALISGYVVDVWSGGNIGIYTPAFVIMIILTAFDLAACLKLQLPIIKPPENIFKDLKTLLNNKHTITFISFAVLAGIMDGFIIYFLFWYLEDLAISTQTTNIKLLEGLIVAAETLGGEVIFFSIAGKILERFGHAHSFSMCFIFYALRLGLISIVPSPWWLLPVEFLMQGPTYALTYTTIVAYANAIAPPGASATMQGIAAGMDDGFGYSLGSILGGLLYKYIGGRGAFQTFSALAVISAVVHLMLYKTYLQHHEAPTGKTDGVEYGSPEEAAKHVVHATQ